MKKFILLLLPLLSVGAAQACDICNLYEFNPIDSKSYVGVFYRQSVFNGYSYLNQSHSFFATQSMLATEGTTGVQHVPDQSDVYQVAEHEDDYERYETWEIRANFRVLPKLNLQAVLPIRKNTVYYAEVFHLPQPMKDTTLTVSGPGDLLLTAEYLHTFSTGSAKHILRPGLGIKLPTGVHNKKITEEEKYDPDLQPGTSAFSYLLKLGYTLLLNEQIGLDQSISQQWMSEGSNGYRFGDQFNYNASAFYVVRKGMAQLIPRVGVYYEAANRSAQDGVKATYTGGKALFGQAGMDVALKKFTVSSSYFQPLSQHLNGNQIGNAGRFQVGVFMNI